MNKRKVHAIRKFAKQHIKRVILLPMYIRYKRKLTTDGPERFVHGQEAGDG
jgi:hypothetical protein